MGWEKRLEEMDHQAEIKANEKLEKKLRKLLGKYYIEDKRHVGKFISNDENAFFVRVAYEAGLTQTKIAEVLGVSRRTIGRCLKRAEK